MREMILFVLISCGLVWGATLVLGDPVEGNRNLAEGFRSLGRTLPGSSQSSEFSAGDVGYSTVPASSGRFVSLFGQKAAPKIETAWALAVLHRALRSVDVAEISDEGFQFFTSRHM